MCVLYYENLQLYLGLGLKLKNALYIRIQSITMAKTIQKNEKKWQNEKALLKLMNNTVYGKTRDKSRIDVKFVRNEEDYSKQISEPSYMSHKIFDSNIVPIYKVTLTFTGLHILGCVY